MPGRTLTVERGAIDLHAPLVRHLLELTVAQRICHIPTHPLRPGAGGYRVEVRVGFGGALGAVCLSYVTHDDTPAFWRGDVVYVLVAGTGFEPVTFRL